MLIRAKSTEERIGEIANRFAQGIGGYAQSMKDDAANMRQYRMEDEAKKLQEEARTRQQALQAFETSSALTEKSGRIITPDMVSPMLKSGDFSGLGDLMKTAPVSPKYQKQLENDELDRDYKRSQINKNNRAATQAPKENLTYAQKLDLKAEKEAIQKARPEAKLESLGAEGRSKVGAIASGFQAIDQMMKASEDGHGPRYVDANTTLIGGLVSDNPYSEAERMTGEVIGRLQSGGAIGEQEVKTFKQLGPRPGDDGPTRTRKLALQRDFLKNKLTAYGLSHDDLGSLGFETTSRYEPKNKAPAYNPQHVQAVKQMSDADLMKIIQGG